jgi:hypothetical protein
MNEHKLTPQGNSAYNAPQKVYSQEKGKQLERIFDMTIQKAKEQIQQQRADVPFKLTMDKQKDILHVKVEGQRTYESLVKITEQIVEACRENNTFRALVDVRAMGGKLAIWESFKLITSCFTRLRDLRVLRQAAIVDREDARPRYKFMETVADNRSYNIRFFEDITEAQNWLAL